MIEISKLTDNRFNKQTNKQTNKTTIDYQWTWQYKNEG